MYKNYNSCLCVVFFFSYFPLIIFPTIHVLSITKNGKSYFNETWYTYKAQRDDVSCTRIIALACEFLELFPFDYFSYNVLSAL